MPFGDFGARRLKLDIIAEPVAVDPFDIKNGSTTYKITSALRRADVANIYGCTIISEDGSQVPGVFKIVRNPVDNDFSENEARILGLLADKPAEIVKKYFASMVDSFTAAEGEDGQKRHVIVFPYSEKFYTFEEVLREYPGGIEARDFAWMFNRLLEGLYFTHKAEVIHGGILPSNIIIRPDNHGLILTEWAYSVRWDGTEILKAVSSNYRSWYPPEVQKKEKPSPALDIYMAAMCGIKLLGGDPSTKTIPDGVPDQIRQFLLDCSADTFSRPTDAGALRERFGEILKVLYGKRQFRPFLMPERDKRIEA